MKYLFSLIILLIFAIEVDAQKYTISGYVRDDATGEDLIGANVYLKELKKGAVTNHYGFYSITVEKGTYTLVISFLGSADFIEKITLDKDIKRTVSLKSTTIVTDEVQITAERSDKNITESRMSTVKMPVEKVKELPVVFGEVDIIKTIQLLPGVQSGGEGSSGFYVRGGGPDQNLILLDEAVVYNAAHLFGFFSVFNADAVKDIELIKGGMPANYGGRLSSVLDISMREGNNKKYEANGGIGLISSRLTIEGPLKKDTSSFIISGRRTYIDVLAQPFIKDSSPLKGSGYYFYDLNTKLNYRFSDNDRLFLSGYFGRDVFKFVSSEADFNMKIPWGNATGSLRWNHLFNSKLFVNTTAIFTDYNFEFQADQEDFEMNLFSGIRDYNGKVDFTYFPVSEHMFKFGAEYIYHTFIPSSMSGRIAGTELDLGDVNKQYANDVAIYVLDDFEISDRLKVNVGLRGTYFQQVGPFTRYIQDDNGIKTDTIVYNKGEEIVSYKHVEPRISSRFTINESSSIKASYTKNYQYIHLATVSSGTLPTDIWIPTSDVVKPQEGDQYAVGYFRNFKDNKYETSIEVYYKDMKNLVEYKDGASPGDEVGNNADNNLTFGVGDSYGVELFFKKSLGKTTGWLGYTWSQTSRTFKNLNDGKTFPAKYDRRHDISAIVTHNLSERLSVSAVFVYATGNAMTLQVGRYQIDGQILSEYSDRNEYRMEAYHRLDISINYEFVKKKRIEHSLNFSVYNVYNHYNPYFIYYAYDGNLINGTFDVTARQTTLFPILPSLTWNFRF